MARFYNGEYGEFRFDSGDGYDVPIDDTNFTVYVARDEPQEDMASMLDTRDSQHWIWFRFDQGQEVFDEMVFVARSVGCFIQRTNHFPEIHEKFDQRHHVTDDEIDGFFNDAA